MFLLVIFHDLLPRDNIDVNTGGFTGVEGGVAVGFLLRFSAGGKEKIADLFCAEFFRRKTNGVLNADVAEHVHERFPTMFFRLG